MSPFIRRLTWAFVPLAVLGAVASTLFGESGLVRRHQLASALAAEEIALEQTLRANVALEQEVRLLQSDSEVLRRAIADERFISLPDPGTGGVGE